MLQLRNHVAVEPLIRHFFNSRQAGNGGPWWTWAAAAAGMIAVVWLLLPGRNDAIQNVLPSPPKFAAVEDIVLSRCGMCHAKEPAWSGLAYPPKGIVLDTPEAIRAHAQLIDMFAVRSHGMPPGNVTKMTDAERQTIAAWIAASHHTE